MISNYVKSTTNHLHLEPASVFSTNTGGDQTSTSTADSVDAEQSDKDPSGTDGSAGDQSPDLELEDQSSGPLPLDQVFEILKNRRRRLVLHYLEENDGESSLSDLAEHIAAIENDTTIKAISSTQRKRVYVGLYQCHLPKMDDMDIIDFDQNRGTVVLSSNAEQVKSYLGEPDEQNWHRMYLGASISGFVLFLVSQFGGHQYGLTRTVVLLTLLVGITAVAIAHAYRLDSVLFGDSSST